MIQPTERHPNVAQASYLHTPLLAQQHWFASHTCGEGQSFGWQFPPGFAPLQGGKVTLTVWHLVIGSVCAGTCPMQLQA